MDVSEYEVSWKITTISDLLTHQAELGFSRWYRGQSDSAFELTPGAFRSIKFSSSENEMLEEFRHFALARSDSHPEGYWDWLVLAQHHGVPTRLLDWTENPLQALFFAVSDAENSETDAKLFVLDPKELNRQALGQSAESLIVLRDSQVLLDAYRSDRTTNGRMLPVAVAAANDFNRIVAQRGVFTLHPSPGGIGGADASLRDAVRVAIIPNEAKSNIKRELEFFCIDESTSYPDLDHLGAHIRRSYSNKTLL